MNKSTRENIARKYTYYIKCVQILQTSARKVERICWRLVRTASFVETISEAESERYWIEEPWLAKEITNWYISLAKALGPLSKTIKYIFWELVPCLLSEHQKIDKEILGYSAETKFCGVHCQRRCDNIYNSSIVKVFPVLHEKKLHRCLWFFYA